MNDALAELIVSELGKHKSENDVVFAVAQQGNMSWDEAHRLVQEVKVERRTHIARRQSPLLLGIALVMAIAGVGLAGYAAFATLDGVIIFFLSLQIPYLGNVVYFVTGVAMVIGAAVGLGQMIPDLLGR
jgi:hypothetical protein